MIFLLGPPSLRGCQHLHRDNRLRLSNPHGNDHQRTTKGFMEEGRGTHLE